MTDQVPPVLAISSAGDALHVGPGEIVLSHVTAETPEEGSETPPTEWEFFDSAGNPLVASVTEEGPVLVRADPEAEPPGRAQRQVLVSRVDLVLAHAQLRLDRFLAEKEAAGEGAPEPGDPVRMVRVDGELDAVLVMLAALDPDLDPTPQGPNPGSWFHNLWHGVFG